MNANYEPSYVLEKVPVYREIELIGNICNEIQQKAQLPTIIAGAIAVLGISTAFLIKTPATPDNIPLFVVMLLSSAETGLFLLFCVGGLAEVYKESSATLQDIKLYLSNFPQGKGRRWLGRFAKSCWVIKMKFGENYFVEELTPLNCISHAIDLSVQILLLG